MSYETDIIGYYGDNSEYVLWNINPSTETFNETMQKLKDKGYSWLEDSELPTLDKPTFAEKSINDIIADIETQAASRPELDSNKYNGIYFVGKTKFKGFIFKDDDSSTVFDSTNYYESGENLFDLDDSSTEVGRGGNDFLVVKNKPTTPANICFPPGTPVDTDQGKIAIEKIQPGIHTINGQVVKMVSSTLNQSKALVVIKKGAFGKNCPTQTTRISPNHSIKFGGKMVKAKSLVHHPYVRVQRTKEMTLVHNVALEEHSTMTVNGLVVETLNPKHADLLRGKK
jgi:hypothetical protein